MNIQETAQLLKRCQTGDSQAVEDFVACYQSQVWHMAYSILREPAEADEACQDALVAALEALDRYRGEAAFSTWLYAITLNVCRGRLRKRQVRGRLQAALESLLGHGGGQGRRQGRQPSPVEAQALGKARDQEVWQAVGRLPADQQQVIALRYYHDMRPAEMARVLGVSERTVHARLARAYERLRPLLSALEEKP